MNKAVLIGINYTHSPKSTQLSGCLNDVKHVLDYLKSKFSRVSLLKIGDDIPKSALTDPHHLCALVLTDDSERKEDDPTYPSRSNILSAFEWLSKDTRADQHRFLHYSGHGSRTRDYSGDEIDHYDETLVPADYKKAGMIIDDLIRTVLIDPLPEGASLDAILDCCHSGTAMDLHYGLLDAEDYKSAKRRYTSATVEFENEKVPITAANVVLWSGCRDDQTSADAWNSQRREFGGALTTAFLSCIDECKSDTSYRLFFKMIRNKLSSGRYTQKSQLSSGRKLDLDTPFRLL